MPLPVLLLLIATLLPLAGFLLLAGVGRRMGTPIAGWVGTGFAAASFVCTMLALAGWLEGGQYVDPSAGQQVRWGMNAGPVHLPVRWVPVGPGVGQARPGFLDVGVYVDSLTVAMFSMVTLVAAVVHVFAVGYMRGDGRFPRFFTYLGLFGFSMSALLLSSTLLQILIFWELVGLCSYLLIGFWYEKRTARNAALKAFLVNRVGDVGFLVGLGILFVHLGNVTLPGLWAALGAAGGGGAITLAGGGVFPAFTLTLAGVGLFCGAAGKSAQFPLHVWLPDAMEGPTPVSALIHAATMVAAGVYLVGRAFPILTPDAKLFVAIVGCVTLTTAALIAVAQTDIKRVLAYSTVSQLGYMMLALGVGSYAGGLFHLVTHAFFKALLFLGAGSVIHAAHHEQEMAEYGGLVRRIPITAVTFGVAVLAIAGTPFLSGFYSKDLILEHAAAFASAATSAGGSRWYWALFVLPAAVAYLTAFYMTRVWMLTFWGRPRNRALHEGARESTLLWLPLVALSVLTVISGYRNVLIARELIEASAKEITAAVRRAAPEFDGFATAWPTDSPATAAAAAGDDAYDPDGGAAAGFIAGPAVPSPLDRGRALVGRYAYWAFAAGIGAGLAVYFNGYMIAAALTRLPPVRWVRVWLYRRMYFDEMYHAVLVEPVLAASRLAGAADRTAVDGFVNGTARVARRASVVAGMFDRHVIDGAVAGVVRATRGLGSATRFPQVGRVRLYVTMLFGALALGLAAAVFFIALVR